MTLKSRLVDLYFADTMPTRYWSIWLMLLAAIGVYLRSDDPSPDMEIMFQLAPWWMWSLALLVLALYRGMGLIPMAVTQRTKIITPLCSMAIWVLFLVAAAHAPKFGLSLMFIVPCASDTWILSRAFFWRMHRHD